MKDKIMTYIFIFYLIFVMAVSVIMTDNKVSYNERRKLTELPKLSVKEITNGNYSKNLEKYFLDQFPLRDNLRSLKANINYKVFKKIENNNIYINNNYIYKSNYPTNTSSINKFVNHINTTKSFLSNNNNIYLAVIPDKNYYLNTRDFLNIDYDYLYKEIYNININLIDLRNSLSISDYYETDTHWKQENILDIANVILKRMNITPKKIDYQKNTYNYFYGVYSGESAIKRKPETLTYLTNDNISNIEVKYLENKKLNKIYNLDKLKSFDSYEVFLDGASSFIEIYNKKSITNKELVIFRDSFASRLTPLLAEYYQKITLIDNRYINSINYLPLIEFNNQDVLFLYSTLIINNSNTIKN